MIALRNSAPSGHAGFSASVDPASVRRQLQVSAGVVVVLGLAIAVSLFELRSDRGIQLGATLQAASFASSAASRTPVGGG